MLSILSLFVDCQLWILFSSLFPLLWVVNYVACVLKHDLFVQKIQSRMIPTIQIPKLKKIFILYMKEHMGHVTISLLYISGWDFDSFTKLIDNKLRISLGCIKLGTMTFQSLFIPSLILGPCLMCYHMSHFFSILL